MLLTMYERLLLQDRAKFYNQIYREMKDYSTSPLLTTPILVEAIANEKLDKLEARLGLRREFHVQAFQ